MLTKDSSFAKPFPTLTFKGERKLLLPEVSVERGFLLGTNLLVGAGWVGNGGQSSLGSEVDSESLEMGESRDGSLSTLACLAA